MARIALLIILCSSLAVADHIESIREALLPKPVQNVFDLTGVCSQGLSNLAKAGDCQYYSCLENQVQCKQNGYPVAHGQRYCSRLDNIRLNLSPKGQRWVDGFKRCSMERINGYLHNMIKSCETMAEVAFHANLFCMPGSEDASICHVINEPTHQRHLVDVFRGSGLDNDHVVHQVMQISRSCLHQNYKQSELGGRASLEGNVNSFIRELQTLLPTTRTEAQATDPSRMTTCEQYARDGDCRFYECFHERFQCGSDAKPDHVLHFEMMTCQMMQTHSRLSPAPVATSWALEHQKCMMQKLISDYKGSSIQCAHMQPLLFGERLNCFHTPEVATCRMNGDDMALMFDRMFDLESYPVAPLRRMMYMANADKEVLLPVYYFRQTALLRTQMGDALCTCRDNAAGECLPLHMPVYNTQADTAHYIMDKQSGYVTDDACTRKGGTCNLTSRVCKGPYEAELCPGPSNRMCCVPQPMARPQICSSNRENAIRGGNDCGGPGTWNAPRGSERYKGIDILCTEGDEVMAPISGKLIPETNSNSTEPCDGMELRIGMKEKEAVSLRYVRVNSSKAYQLVQRGEVIGVHVACNKPTCSIPYVSLTRWQDGSQTDPTPEYGGPVVDPEPPTTTDVVSANFTVTQQDNIMTTSP